MRESSIGIPHGGNWPEISLADVTKLLRRGISPTYVDSSTVHAIGQRCVQRGGFKAEAARPHDSSLLGKSLVAESGDVLLNSTGMGTIGRSCIFDAEGIFVVDSHVTILRARPELVEPRWIDLLLRSPWGQAHLESHCFAGSTNQVELSRMELARTAIPVPSLDEQRRIISSLDSVSELERSVEISIAKLRSVRAGMVLSVLRQVSGAPQCQEDGGLLGSRLLRIEAGRSPDLAEVQAVAGEWGVLKVSAVHTSGFRPQENKAIPLDMVDPRYEVHAGDLLISRANTPELVGSSCVATESKARLLLSDKTLRLVVNPRLADARYVNICLSTPGVRAQIGNNSSGSSLSMQNISQEAIEKLTLPWPALTEQKKIADEIESCDDLIAEELEGLVKLQKIWQGLQEYLLTRGSRML
ncbi:restriction endonuclease subunit S [Streptomyces sp. NPDC058662]|uniref:restriction endonuclease subunit S n=1 Tax=Streptomyces sp. NPDC058662 TaxID=3346583 RepID=UPI00364F5B1B